RNEARFTELLTSLHHCIEDVRIRRGVAFAVEPDSAGRAHRHGPVAWFGVLDDQAPDRGAGHHDELVVVLDVVIVVGPAGILDRHDDPGGKIDRVIVPREYRIEVRCTRRDGHRGRQVYECYITLWRYGVEQAIGAVIRSMGLRHERGHGARLVAD